MIKVLDPETGIIYSFTGAATDEEPWSTEDGQRFTLNGLAVVLHFVAGFEPGPNGYTTAICGCEFGYFDFDEDCARYDLEHDHIRTEDNEPVLDYLPI